MPPVVTDYRGHLVIFLSKPYSAQLNGVSLLGFVAADMMITLLSKGLRLRKYFFADDDASVHQVLLSCVHVSFSTAFKPLKCSALYFFMPATRL